LYNQSQNPPNTSRIFAYSAIALYQLCSHDARLPVVAKAGIGLQNLPQAQVYGQLDYTITANAALYQVARQLKMG
jgi:hypothetical protein